MDNANDFEPLPPPLAIEGEEEWFRRYGLHGEPCYGDESYTNQQEAKERVKAAERYQQSVHAKFFQKDSEEEMTTTTNTTTTRNRMAMLQAMSNQIVRIITANHGDFIEYNLRQLASSCDTIYTMAESRPRFQSDSTTPLLVSLEQYSIQSVSYFLRLLEGDNLVDNTTYPNTGVSDEMDGQIIVDCCEIASYLQCPTLLDDILVPALIWSVDSANCLSLYQLADRLHLPSLVEASVNHMMRSLGSVEEHAIWDDLTPELRERIKAIQHILQSSNRTQLFFSSFDEYLAVFAEQVDYYRERLEDALHEQALLPNDSKGWAYAQAKIDHQQERVRILKLVLQEQKNLFRPKKG